MTNGSIAVVSAAPEQFGTIALATLRDLLGGFDEPVVGLPTGRTPVALYEAMARRQYTFPPGARLFAIDEYCSPTRREGTNAAFFDRFLPRASCHAAIALERKNVGRNAVQKPSIMAADHRAPAEPLQAFFQGAQCIHVQIVCRLIKD